MLKQLEARYTEFLDESAHVEASFVNLEDKVWQAGQEAQGILNEADLELLQMVRSRLENMQGELRSFGTLIGDAINRHVIALDAEDDPDILQTLELRYSRPAQPSQTA